MAKLRSVLCSCGLALVLVSVLVSEACGLPSLMLSSGYEMPIIGLGTWLSAPNDVDLAVTTALESGYTHIDTAYFYENEVAIGESLKKYFAKGGKREDLFITTKLPLHANNAVDVEKFLKLSLEALSFQYVDMYLIHNPVGLARVEKDGKYELVWNDDGSIKIDETTDLVAVWKAMEAQVKAGRTRSIGLSNFNQSQILNIINHAEIIPSNLQIEMHAYLRQKELVEFCKKHEVVITAYGTFGSPGSKSFHSNKDATQSLTGLLENPVVQKIAQNHKKTTAQVLLRHSIQNDIIVIPKSVKPERIRENVDVFDFELTDEEMKAMGGLDKGEDGRLFNLALNSMFKGTEKHPEYPFPL